jgi:hypothetical protein
MKPRVEGDLPHRDGKGAAGVRGGRRCSAENTMWQRRRSLFVWAMGESGP